MKLTLTKAELQAIVSDYLKANGLRLDGNIDFDSYNRVSCDVTWLSPKKVEKSEKDAKNDNLEGIKKGLALDVS